MTIIYLSDNQVFMKNKSTVETTVEKLESDALQSDTTTQATLSVTLSADLKEWAVKHASKNFRSLSQFLTMLIHKERELAIEAEERERLEKQDRIAVYAEIRRLKREHLKKSIIDKELQDE